MDDQVQIIDVPGHGEVEFPASMSDAEILAALRKLAPPPQKSAAEQAEGQRWPGQAKLTQANKEAVSGTLAAIGAPLGMAAGMSGLGAVGSMAPAVGRILTAPAVGAALGGVEGYRRGGVMSGLTGAMTGYIGGRIPGDIGRLTSALSKAGPAAKAVAKTVPTTGHLKTLAPQQIVPESNLVLTPEQALIKQQQDELILQLAKGRGRIYAAGLEP